MIRYLINIAITKYEKLDLAVSNEDRMKRGVKTFEDLGDAIGPLFEEAGIVELPSPEVLALFDDPKMVDVVPINQKKEETEGGSNQ